MGKKRRQKCHWHEILRNLMTLFEIQFLHRFYIVNLNQSISFMRTHCEYICGVENEMQ
jgi:hypothetical protein